MNPDFLKSHIATGKPEFYLHYKVVDWAKGHYKVIKGPIKLSKYSWRYSSVNRHLVLGASFNEKSRDLFLFYLISDKTKKLKSMKEQHSETLFKKKMNYTTVNEVGFRKTNLERILPSGDKNYDIFLKREFIL